MFLFLSVLEIVIYAALSLTKVITLAFRNPASLLHTPVAHAISHSTPLRDLFMMMMMIIIIGSVFLQCSSLQVTFTGLKYG
jgi:flagellar biosynthesis regulator FlbT